MNLRFIKKIKRKFLYYSFAVVISMFLAAFIIFNLVYVSDVQDYESKNSLMKNDMNENPQVLVKINDSTKQSNEIHKELNENSKKIQDFKQLTSEKTENTDIENIELANNIKRKDADLSGSMKMPDNGNREIGKPDTNIIFTNIEKFEKLVIDDTIELLPETELSNYEIIVKDSVINKELLDGITVALFENQTDSLDSNEIIYNYINTAKEAILRRIKGQSHISPSDFNDKSSITFSDYLFQAENKLIKVRLIAFEEYDVSDKIFMPEAFGVNIISWNDNLIEMDWFINSGILEIPPEEIKIQVSGKHCIKIALGVEAVYGIGSSN